jgi:hypothetical protein
MTCVLELVTSRVLLLPEDELDKDVYVKHISRGLRTAATLNTLRYAKQLRDNFLSFGVTVTITTEGERKQLIMLFIN